MKFIFLFILLAFFISCGDTITQSREISCKENGECPGGYCNEAGKCAIYSCSQTDDVCLDETTLSKCSSDRSKMETITCNFKCYNNECIESLECRAGEKLCLNENEYLECNDELMFAKKSCSNDTKCLNGECTNVVCEPNEKICKNRYTIRTCNGNGTGFYEVNCSENEECIEGICKSNTTIVCTPNEKDCNNNNQIITCSANGEEWVVSESCGNNVCSLGECKEKICEPNEKQCVDDNNQFIKQCSEDGTQWKQQIQCGLNKVCLNDECVDIICNPNQTKCINTESYETCNSNGTEYEGNVNCENDEVCYNGQCIEKTCSPNEFTCIDSQFIQKCNATGTGYSQPIECGTGLICVENNCKPIVCNEGDVKCDGSKIQYCKEDGTGYDTSIECENNQTCEANQCVNMICEPNESTCANNSLVQTCNSRGTGYITPVSCGINSICLEGVCQNKVCNPTQKYCIRNENAFQQCNLSGTAYEGRTDCGANTSCQDGNCVAVICEPDSQVCENTTQIKVCNSSGTAYSQAFNCGDGLICKNNSCVQIVCNVGETKCDGDLVQVCKADRTGWETSASCGNNKICEGNACVNQICTPNQQTCASTSLLQTCNSRGTGYITPVACGINSVCSNNSCQAKVCNPSQKYCVEGQNAFQQCNATGTGYLATTNCGGSQVCQDGNCANVICTPDAQVCENTTQIKVCNSSGTAYSQAFNCGDGLICKNNSCVQIVCNVGETKCDGDKVQVCKADRTGWETSANCPNGQICEGNACIPYVCSVGQRTCANDLLYQVCNSRRTGYDNPIPCGNNQICTGSGVCQNKVCSAGQTLCDTTDATYKKYYTCNSTGSAWSTTTSSCSNTLVCDVTTNQCKSPICVANSMRCLNENGVIKSQQCNASGTAWLSAVTCTGTDPVCTENGCENIICNPYEEIDCTSTTQYKRCNLNGTAFETTTETCPNNYLCKNKDSFDQCVPIICQPNGKTCVSETQFKQCNSDGTELSIAQSCPNSAASGQPETCYGGECNSECEMSAINRSYMGCDYYAVELQNASGSYDDGSYAIIISNPSDFTASVTISNNGNTYTRNVNPNAIEIFDVADNPLMGTVKDNQKPWHIVSNLPIIAYQFSPLGGAANYSNDASILLPTTAYGKEYRNMTWETMSQATSTYPGFITIIAKENNTTVNVTPKVNTIAGTGISAITANTLTTFILNQGEVLQLATTTNANRDLSGSLINSDKPIGVFGSNACTQIPYGTERCDHIEEQLFPTDTWGGHYIVVKTNSRNKLVNSSNTVEREFYKIVSNADNTEITFNPASVIGGSGTTTLTNGQVYIFNTNTSFEVFSTKPIMMGQFMTSVKDTVITNVDNNKGGDPAFILQVPVEQYRNDYLFLVPNTYTYDYVTIIAPIDASVLLDGVVINSGDFTILNSAYKYVIKSLTDGTHSVVSDEPVGISVYGIDAHVSYGYPGGLDLKSVK